MDARTNEALANRVAALESLVIDLTAVIHRLSPDRLTDRLDRPGLRPHLTKEPQLLGDASERRRRKLVAAAVPALAD